MKILNLSQKDWARFQWDNMNALRSVGLECDSITMQRHEFYNEQSEVVPCLGDVIKRIANYDVIQFFHDNVALFDLLYPAMVGKKVITYHTSSYYRANSAYVNSHMAPVAYKQVCAMPEFMAMCPRGVYMVGAVDTDRIKPGGWIGGERPVFAHYPSNPNVKGTAKIVELMARTSANFHYSTETVSYDRQLQRMNMCDVYIEMFTEFDGMGSAYGDFGITALESAAMGKVVVTNSSNHTIYEKHYGDRFFYAPKNERGFINTIEVFTDKRMLNCNPTNSRDLVVKNHSYKATGNYFLKNVL